ncbi:MAG: DUF1080 domain-containing protein [Kiritimatiellaeota bacterium]|nr:DUF1080 domain-containing protein [Kiritimatiellota bacterium]
MASMRGAVRCVILPVMAWGMMGATGRTAVVGARGKSQDAGEIRLFHSRNSWAFDGGNWAWKDGALVQGSVEGRPTAFYRDHAFGDMSLQVEFRVQPRGRGVRAAGMLFGSTSSTDATFVHFDTRNRQVIVWQRRDVGGHHRELGRARGLPLNDSVWHIGRVDLFSGRLRVYLDGRVVLRVPDVRPGPGLVGLYTSQGGVAFREFRIRSVPVPPPENWRIRRAWQVEKEQKAAEILWTRVLCKEPGRYIGWPTICRTRGGELLAIFSGDRDAHVCPWGKVQLVRSKDNGETWSEPEIVCNTPLDDRDAGIIQTGTGTLVMAWFTSLAFEETAKAHAGQGGVWGQWLQHAMKLTPDLRERWLGYWTRRSEDNGRTWEPPVRTRGSAPHGPIALSDGRLLYVGRRNPHRGTELTVEESIDDGRSWNQIASIKTAPGDPITAFHEPHAVEAADGTIIAQFRFHFTDPRTHRMDNSKSYLRQAESRDGGRTWTVAHQVPLLGYPPHLIRLRNGWLVSVYGRRLAPYGEYACISHDGGTTWDVENEIKLAGAENGDLGYPASAELADGSILTVYYQIDRPGEKTCLMGTLWRPRQ